MEVERVMMIAPIGKVNLGDGAAVLRGQAVVHERLLDLGAQIDKPQPKLVVALGQDRPRLEPVALVLVVPGDARREGERVRVGVGLADRAGEIESATRGGHSTTAVQRVPRQVISAADQRPQRVPPLLARLCGDRLFLCCSRRR